MSKGVKIVYAFFNTFGVLGLSMLFLYIDFYLQFLAALHQNALYINLTYVLAGVFGIALLLSLVSGWMFALQKVHARVRMWMSLLLLPWVIAAVMVVAVSGYMTLSLFNTRV